MLETVAASLPPGPGPAAMATERSIRRMVDVIVPLWLLAIVANVVSSGVDQRPLPVAAGLVAVLLGYLAFLAGAAPAVLTAVLVFSALLIAVSGPPVATLSVFPLVVPWLNMATTVTGALSAGRRGLAAVVAVALAGGLAVAWGSQVSVVLLSGIVAQALVGGICMWAGMLTLRQAAAMRDRAAGELLAARAEAAAEQARADEQRQVARVLHDTVVNTLGAIRALPQRDQGRLRVRCAEDLAALDAQVDRVADTAILDPADLLAGLASRASSLGLDLTVAAPDGAGPPLAPEVGRALDGALREALVNTAKHAGRREATLRWRWDGRTGEVELADRGPGLAGHELTGGGAESILARCAEAGIEVRAYDRAGTVIELLWRAGASSLPSREQPRSAPDAILGLAAARVGLALSGFGAYSTLVTPAGPGRWGSAAAVGLTGAAVAWAVAAYRGRARTSLPLVAYAAVVVLATVLPAAGLAGCARIGWYWWGPLAGLSLLITIALIDGRVRAVVVGLVAYLCAFGGIFSTTPGLSAACSSETLSIIVLDVGIVLAVIALRRALLVSSRAAESLWEQAEAANLEVAREQARAQVRRRELDRARAACRPLLAGIAAGSVDPADPGVRRAAGRAEAALRAVIALPADLGSLAGDIADAVLSGAGRGVTITVLVQGASAPEPGTARTAGGFIREWSNSLRGWDGQREQGLALEPAVTEPLGLERLPMEQAGPPALDDATAQVTLLGMGGRSLLMLLGPEPEPQSLLQPPPGWSRTDDPGQSLFETSWDDAATMGPGDPLPTAVGAGTVPARHP